MISSLKVKNLGIISDIEISFTKGVNIITGETGAGKSIIVNAISLILGGKADTSKIRKGSDRITVECVFSNYPKSINSILDEMEIDIEEELYLRRVVDKKGKGGSYINGIKVQLSVLKRIGELLVDQHGQNDHQSLIYPSFQLYLIDKYCGLSEKREQFEKLYDKYNAIVKEIEEKENNLKEIEEKKSFLKFRIEELEKCDIRKGEKSTVESELNLLENMEFVKKSANEIYKILYEDDNSVMEIVGRIKSLMEEIKSIDDSLDMKGIEDVEYGIESVANEMRLYMDRSVDEDELRYLRERMDLILDMENRYHRDWDELPKYLNELKDELNSIDYDEEYLDKLKEERNRIANELEKLGKELSDKRKKGALKLEKEIKKYLPDVGMQHAFIKIEFDKKKKGLDINGSVIGRDGIDDVRFIFHSNPGMEGLPLSKIASGGEISRIMLVLKTIFADVDEIPTMIFDEIDAGIGGETAVKVSELIKKLGEKKQIIMITHLPQMAVIGDLHIKVIKIVDKNETNVVVKKLTQKERDEEIKRMVGGDEMISKIKGGQR